MFRMCCLFQLPPSLLVACFPLVVMLLDSPTSVVHTYAAHCIERIFITRDLMTGQFSVAPADLQKFLASLDDTVPSSPGNNLFSHLMAPRLLGGPTVDNPGGILEENEYTMKCMINVLRLVGIV